MGEEAVNRWTDPDGHDWPITGDTCAACGLPLIKVDGNSAHPTCDLRKDTSWPTKE